MNELTETKTNIHDKVIELKKDIERSFIKMGGMLKLVRDNKLYLEKGCVTFEEYIAIPELALNRSTVYAIINVFETFFEKSNQSDIEGLTEIGYSKLNRISQFKDQPDFDEWIYKAKTLSLSDLGLEIKEAKGISENLSSTKSEDKITMEITCPFCGKKFDYLVKQCII
jgi:predicted nuclease of restriction endonuclease-like RecB superfamily